MKVYGYGDIEGPTALTGKKLLPVMEYVDENNQTHYMRESLDLIEYLEKEDGEKNRALAPAAVLPEVPFFPKEPAAEGPTKLLVRTREDPVASWPGFVQAQLTTEPIKQSHSQGFGRVEETDEDHAQGPHPRSYSRNAHQRLGE